MSGIEKYGLQFNIFITAPVSLLLKNIIKDLFCEKEID